MMTIARVVESISGCGMTVVGEKREEVSQEGVNELVNKAICFISWRRVELSVL